MNTGIPRFSRLMWGVKTPRKSRLLRSTKGEEDFLKYLRKDSVNLDPIHFY